MGPVEQVLAELGFKANVSMVILTMALLLARVIPVIIFSPFLGGEAVPSEVRMGLGVTLGLVLFPGVGDQVTNIPTSTLPFIALLLKEVFIGVCLAFVVNSVFEAATVAGTMVDTLAGTNMAQVMVPQTQQQVSLFANLKTQLAVVLFLTLNGHHVVIETLAHSFAVIPLDRFPPMSQGTWPFFDLLLRIFGDMMVIGLALSAPAFLATFMTDLALGMINRVAPQVQVFFISMQLKPMVAVMMIFTTLYIIVQRLHVEFAVMLRHMRTAIILLG